MSTSERLHLKFVDTFSRQPEERTLYVSIPFATAMHLCCCGCGNEVVTPLSPTDWKMTFDGVSIWLHPSIGNWDFPCRSHYWIRENGVEWAPDWTQEQVERGRAVERAETCEDSQVLEVETVVHRPEPIVEEIEATRTKWQVFTSWIRNFIFRQ